MMDITFRVARVGAGLTLVEASKRLGISRPTLIAIEKGRTAPSILTLEKMARVYGLQNWRDFTFPVYSK